MLTQAQIDSTINAIINVLEKFDVPYKTLDNTDGSRNGVRWSNVFYVYPVNDDNVENAGNYSKFRFFCPSGPFNFDESEIKTIVHDMETIFSEANHDLA